MIAETRLTRKEQILETATTMFAERGYSSTSVRDIAQVLGIEAPSLYAHIRSKEELLVSICLPMARQFMEAMRTVQQSGDHAVTKLEEIIRAHVTILTQDLNASAVFWNENKHLSGEEKKDFLTMEKDYEENFKSILVQGRDECEFEIVDVNITAMIMLTSLNNLHVWYDPQYTSIGDLKTQFITILINGIKNTNNY